jgi:hypothetical protein
MIFLSGEKVDHFLRYPRQFLVETLRDMEGAVQGSVHDLVFNLDEVDVSDWENRKLKRIVVPRAFGNWAIHHGINGSESVTPDSGYPHILEVETAG